MNESAFLGPCPSSYMAAAQWRGAAAQRNILRGQSGWGCVQGKQQTEVPMVTWPLLLTRACRLVEGREHLRASGSNACVFWPHSRHVLVCELG